MSTVSKGKSKAAKRVAEYNKAKAKFDKILSVRAAVSVPLSLELSEGKLIANCPGTLYHLKPLEAIPVIFFAENRKALSKVTLPIELVTEYMREYAETQKESDKDGEWYGTHAEALNFGLELMSEMLTKLKVK